MHAVCRPLLLICCVIKEHTFSRPAIQCHDVACIGMLQDCAVVSAARDALESVLQLLTRCSCLGSLEAFFMADELVEYFQSAMQAAEQVKTKMQTSSSTQAVSTSMIAVFTSAV